MTGTVLRRSTRPDRICCESISLRALCGGIERLGSNVAAACADTARVARTRRRPGREGDTRKTKGFSGRLSV